MARSTTTTTPTRSSTRIKLEPDVSTGQTESDDIKTQPVRSKRPRQASGAGLITDNMQQTSKIGRRGGKEGDGVDTGRRSTSKRARVKREDLSASPLSPSPLDVKDEPHDDLTEHEPKPNLTTTTPVKSKSKSTSASTLMDKKLEQYLRTSTSSPFPDFPRPSPAEAKHAHSLLISMHGPRHRPRTITASSSRAGCGDSPSVLDALIRTILSQNTSDTNSSRAKRSMDSVYGSSDNWPEIMSRGQGVLQDAIKCGGLAAVKSKVILTILGQVYEKYGIYSLDHLHEKTNQEAMLEMMSFQGVGPKTASCVLLFCLGRASFAVDTHVHRITGLLGWRPAKASRDETHAHLEGKLPDEDKYGLHVLMVTHGKVCGECKAGGKVKGECALRRAFPGGRWKGQGGEGLGQGQGQGVKGEREGTGEVNEEAKWEGVGGDSEQGGIKRENEAGVETGQDHLQVVKEENGCIEENGGYRGGG